MSEPGTSEPGLSAAAYAAVLAKLFGARRAGINFGLERMDACLAKLALSHTPRAIVQVAGTNGKGSTSTYLEQILLQAGHTVGVFSSPHLLSICERFRINGRSASRERFIAAFEAVQELAGELTFFESITAIAAWLFNDAKVDVAIYEVGLGGRLDSTTAIASTLSIITGIGIDHCEFLGDSLEEIAMEKAGIFRPGVSAILGRSAPESIRTLLAEQAEKPLWVGDEHLAALPANLAMPGAHQRENAACALLAAQTLRGEQGIAIEARHIAAGLCTARLPGRMQEVQPGVWIDGAHNVQAAEALASLLEGQGKVTLVVGLSNTKDIAGFLAPLRPYVAQLIATAGRGDRAYSAAQIGEAAEALGFASVQVEGDSARAVALAMKRPEPTLITGSLLLLGEVLSDMGDPSADPIVVTDPSKASD
tara:strand:- start:2214 stop:3479 length:1266 start_codon:yes stop_codon:yes gene_type:complete